MSTHVTELLVLGAAGVLDAREAMRLDGHLRECTACAAEAAEWRRLVEGLARLPPPRPSPALVARAVEAVEQRRAERSERAWNSAALAFAVGFAWTMAIVSWLLLDLLTGELAVRLERPVGPTAAWYAAYVVAGWLTAGAAAVLLSRRPQEEGGIT